MLQNDRANAAGGRVTIAGLDARVVDFTQQAWPAFADLWSSYPCTIKDSNGEDVYQHPSNDSWASNQCAVRLCVALERAGVDLEPLRQYAKKNGWSVTSEGWVTGSTAVAQWLSITYGAPQKMSNQAFDETKECLQGIFYRVPFDGGQSLGHIDLLSNGEAGSGFASGQEVWFWGIE